MRSSPELAVERIRFVVRSDDALAHDGPNVILNLTKQPKKISEMYVYDKVGTRLFERQCETPEYYLRRVESALLRAHASAIVELCGFLPVVELGAGTAEKTRIVLAEYEKRAMHCDYYAIDIDTETLFATAHTLAHAFPRLFVHCVGATYLDGLRLLPACATPRLFLCLGSSLGNMELDEIDELLGQLFRHSARGDYLLVGVDLDKDPAIIDRAYNDSAGYGARSTLNMLAHLNRRYGGNFIMDQFRYVSRYDDRARRNEVRLESVVEQTVVLAALDFRVSFDQGESIDAEVMWKFDPEELAGLLERAGFSLQHRWIDPIYRYGLFLVRRK